MLSRARAAVADYLDARADRRANPRPSAVVAINRRPRPSPWGGGNQFIEQITEYLRAHGCSVRFALDAATDCVLLVDPRSTATASFDVAAIEAARRDKPGLAVIQRVNDNDKHRGSTDRDRVQATANHVADCTVFLSAWLRDYEAARWFDPRRPHAVIWNGADDAAFTAEGAEPFRAGNPLRLVTHHWSKEWNKGFAAYVEIDRLIAEGGLPQTELWVIGRWPDEIVWRSARTFPPARPREVAALLRQCHVYVTASKWESGGMHFIEGAQCGLPVVFHRDGGGIVEVAERFGVGFTGDVGAAIEEMRAGYDRYRARVIAEAPSGRRMCEEYGALIQRVIQEKRTRT